MIYLCVLTVQVVFFVLTRKEQHLVTFQCKILSLIYIILCKACKIVMVTRK